MKRRIFVERAVLEKEYDEAFDLLSKAGAGIGKEFEVCVVFEELFTNVAKYAYAKDDESRPAVICIEVDDAMREVSLELYDWGVKFNPVEYLSAGFSLVGGHGLEMVKAYASAFEYRRQFSCNAVRVRFKKDAV